MIRCPSRQFLFLYFKWKFRNWVVRPGHIPRCQCCTTRFILIPLKWLGANFWFLQTNLRIRKMCWLHPGLAFKLPCVLLSLFMISVTLASLPCHFTNCCRGVYGEAPFPNVSDFREPAQKPSAFTAWSQKCVCLPGQGLLFSLRSTCGCLQKLSVCVCVCSCARARQGRTAP